MTQLKIDEVATNRYRISGELDMDSAPRLEEALAPLIGASEHFVLDLGDLIAPGSTPSSSSLPG